VSLEVTVIVVSYNTRELLRRALMSVRASGVPCETIVVDNASHDGSVAMVGSEFPEARVIETGSNVGFAAANNRALPDARGRYVLLLNPDAELCPGTLLRLIAELDAHPRAAAAGPTLLFPDGRFQSCGQLFPTVRSELQQSRRIQRWFPKEGALSRIAGPQATRWTDWVDGACLLVRRDAIAAVGLLDERYFLYGEEVDWQYRMHRAGMGVLVVQDATAIHHQGQSGTPGSVTTLQCLVETRLRFFQTHRGMAIAMGVSLIMAAGFLKQILDGSARQTGVQGRSDSRVKLRAIGDWWATLCARPRSTA
jgi:N-acetylglucosaminyl-diphospho-decaprenol L-rhamnosyltransferase